MPSTFSDTPRRYANPDTPYFLIVALLTPLQESTGIRVNLKLILSLVVNNISFIFLLPIVIIQLNTKILLCGPRNPLQRQCNGFFPANCGLLRGLLGGCPIGLSLGRRLNLGFCLWLGLGFCLDLSLRLNLGLGLRRLSRRILLNLLAGFDRAIVTPIAGTTRDVLEQAVMLGDTGIRLNLFDTAGVRDVGEHGDAVEAEGIRRSWKKLEEAGLVLAVFDLAAPLNEEDLEIARRCQGRPALAILNKQDLAGQGEAFTAAQQQLAPYFKAIIPLTARDAASLQPLCQAVAQLLGTANLDPNAAALCSARQLSAAKEARDALAEALNSQEDGFGLDAAGVCISDAQRALARLTGEDATEATIDEVFSTFCVGK